MRAVVLAVVLVVGALLGTVGTAGASSAAPSGAGTTVPVELPDGCAGSALTKPGCGTEPEASGDRGGAAQLALAAIVLAGMGTIFAVVIRAGIRSSRPAPAEPAVHAEDPHL